MQRGDIVQLGNHWLMCGDAGSPDDVAALFGDRQADLVFTSPPYLQQRTYGKAIACWDTLMQSVFGCLPVHASTQVLVNLGMVHRGGEWLPYWDGWVAWMRTQGWRRHALSVWDKGVGLPLDPRIGRLYPAFEFIFHFNRQAQPINRTLPCKSAGTRHHSSGLREASGKTRTRDLSRVVMSHRVPDDVWRIGRHMQRGPECDHGAVFPVALPIAVHAAYADVGELVYDPFLGSGTSLLAAEQGGRICYGMEVEPTYCEMALARWQAWQAKAAKATP